MISAENGIESMTDNYGRTTSFTYDSSNRLTGTTYADGSVSAMEYDAAGQVIATIDENGNRTTFAYDGAGRRVRVRDALGNETTFAYDGNGNQTGMTDALGHVTQYEYDVADNLVKTIFHDGSATTAQYDGNGNKTSETDAEGRTTRFEYDAANRLIKVIDALNQETVYTYDEVGNRLSQTDPNGHAKQWEYDDMGRVTRHVLPEGESETFTYYPDGTTETHTDFNGNTTTFTYDACCGRLLSKSFHDGTSIVFTYSGTGKRSKITDSYGVTQYSYDLRDRLIGVIEPDGTTLNYTYDGKGNRTSVTTASGTVSHTFDALNRLAATTGPDGGSTGYTYDSVGNRKSVTLPGGTITEYHYDALNRLIDMESRKSTGEVIDSYAYILGPAGNRIQVTESSGRVVSYSYDSLYRLTQEVIIDPALGNETITYTYDAFGNRLSKTDSSGSVTYNYDDNDRLITEYRPGTSLTYYYDDNGNTIGKSDGTGSVQYGYDAENRLIMVQNESGKIANYAYDADGIRMAAVNTDGTQVRFVVDKNRPYAQVLEERDGAGSLTVRYVFGDDLISQHRGGVDRYYLCDGQLSIRELVDSIGNVTDTYVFDAFGVLLDQAGTTENHFLYTSEMRDNNTEFYYLRARYMNPNTGRFVTTDPWEGSTQEPVSLHKYLYANANPVMNIDPTGLYTLMSISSAAGIRNTLASLQFDTGSRIIHGALGNDNDKSIDLAIVGLAFAGSVPILGNVGKWATTTGKNIIKSKQSWLWKHEKYSGHTISRHVLVNNRWLLSRLRKDPTLTFASRFKDLKIAEEVIEKAIFLENNKINRWLRNGKRKGKLVVNYSGSKVIGYGISKGSRKATKLKNVRVVLKKNGRGTFFILTSFPTP